ncbi:NTP pyrophosphohydrolase [Actinomyces wuliandei]|uniref:NTP pyrophosphohydrolase n=2 Tax=Actinomyces wuliandei TaxID=2057743 RepID=UPI000FD9A464|nr:NTP pyrophosphohydrolase [Actinomyces wuliandei]
MRKFVTWDVDTRFGRGEMFKVRQTPEIIADEITQSLTVPTYLTGGPRFSLGVRPLPEGMDFPDDLPEDHPYRHAYMQAAGSHQAMTVELRVPDPADGYTHYTVARHPVTDPDSWVPLTWDNGGNQPFTTHVHPEEVFTGHQAAPLFRAYILHDTTPPPHLLRQLDI